MNKLEDFKERLRKFTIVHAICNPDKKFVFGRGSLNPEIVFVGEAPGKEENEQGKPFVGRSGKLLDKQIEFLGLKPDQYAVVNAIPVMPTDEKGNVRTPTEDELLDFSPFLREQLMILNPKTVVALGKSSAFALGFRANLTHAGTFLDDQNKIFFIPHPAYLLRNGQNGFNYYEQLKQPERLLDSLEINYQQAENLALQEMVSPLIAGLHYFAKKSGTQFVDFNQKDICVIGGKKAFIRQRDITTGQDMYVLEEELEKMKDIELFILAYKESGLLKFIGFCGQRQLVNDGTILFAKINKPSYFVKPASMHPMHEIIPIRAEQKIEEKIDFQHFVPLHCHTGFSIGDAYGSVDQIAEEMKKRGFKASAITDHGTLAGTFAFQKAMLEKNLKPIIGIEAYIVEEYSDSAIRHHITIWIANEIGWKNILALQSEANRAGYYYKPRILLKSLLEKNEGLVIGTGCPQGLLSKHITEGNFEKAFENAKLLKSVFEDRMFVEIMPHYEIPEMEKINSGLFSIAKQLDIKMIFSGDWHYPDSSDKKIHNAIKAINMRKKYGEANYTGNTYWYMQEPEIKKLFEGKNFDVDELLANTNLVADMCEFEIKPQTEETLPNIKLDRDKKVFEEFENWLDGQFEKTKELIYDERIE